MKKIIGVIGGNGVAATNKLCELIENKLTLEGAFRDVHHPEIIIYQATQAPSRSMFVEGRGPSYIEDYVNIGKKLKDTGVSVLCMCCNTAHYAIEEIQKRVDIPFINIIEEVALEAKKMKKQKLGLIASDGCVIGKVYEKWFDKIYPEAQIIYPSIDFQKEVTRGICNMKNKNRFLEDNHPDRPQTIFSNLYNHLIEKGAEIVIMGCTDIRVDFNKENTIDSLEILVNKIINLTQNEK
ncbi:MAG: amino acid racemase [Bacteroidales bacterium]|jgi:aspartate racemase|nr:amino acid racemase [Bacteroidales bacterium]